MKRGLTTAEVAETTLRARHLRLEIEAGTERPPGPGEHDAADVGIVVGAQQQLADLLAASSAEIVFIRSGAFSVRVATWSTTPYNTSVFVARCASRSARIVHGAET